MASEVKCPLCNRTLGYRGFDLYVWCLPCRGWTKEQVVLAYDKMTISDDCKEPMEGGSYNAFKRVIAIVDEFDLLLQDAYDYYHLPPG